MIAADIRSRLEQELSSVKGFVEPHGITIQSIKSQLGNIRPASFKYPNEKDGVKVWIVFDECPASPERGYLIIFDPEEGKFGLAAKNGIILGLTGSFLETLHGI